MPTREPFCICQRQTALVRPVEPGWRPSWDPLIVKKAQPDITVRSMGRTPEKHWGKCGISTANLTVWLFCKVGHAQDGTMPRITLRRVHIESVFAEGGEMSARMRCSTGLHGSRLVGAVAAIAASLRSRNAGLWVSDAHLLGPTYIMLYNDAYGPLIGTKHRGGAVLAFENDGRSVDETGRLASRCPRIELRNRSSASPKDNFGKLADNDRHRVARFGSPSTSSNQTSWGRDRAAPTLSGLSVIRERSFLSLPQPRKERRHHSRR